MSGGGVSASKPTQGRSAITSPMLAPVHPLSSNIASGPTRTDEPPTFTWFSAHNLPVRSSPGPTPVKTSPEPTLATSSPGPTPANSSPGPTPANSSPGPTPASSSCGLTPACPLPGSGLFGSTITYQLPTKSSLVPTPAHRPARSNVFGSTSAPPPSAKNSASSTLAHQLQSSEHKELLDAIDRLRHEDIDEEISIPEIVVCGDQSSGKSSVLEAIAGVSFPKGSGTVTCFPTEVVLRKAPRELPVEIRISPASHGWTINQRNKIEQWRPPFPVNSASLIPNTVIYMKTFLQSLDDKRNFWYDRLRIVLSGPEQPHLTLIDLPGLIQNEQRELRTGGESARTGTMNKKQICELTLDYIRREQAVVLAVVDAPNDIERHQIMQLLRENGCNHRAMGILTKPDLLLSGSDDEKARVRMVTRPRQELGLGWHVLRNLPHEALYRCGSDRDDEERSFFSREAWSRIPEERRGGPSLRSNLSHQLFARIQQGLPELIGNIKAEIANRDKLLHGLGHARETEHEKRHYLAIISEKLVPLIRAAVTGEYEHEEVRTFFGNRKDRKLREIINQHTDHFSSAMSNSGRLYRIVDTEDQGSDEYPKLSKKASIQFPSDPSLLELRKSTIDFKSYLYALAAHIDSNRGILLRGTVPPTIYKTVFMQLSLPWKDIVRGCATRCLAAVRLFLKEACYHVAGPFGGSKILNHLVTPEFLQRRDKLDEKIDELMWPYLHGHPTIAYHKFVAVSSNRTFYDKDNLYINQLWDQATPSEVAAANALDTANAYYEHSCSTLIQNVVTLGIERCLLHELANTVSTSAMHGLEPEKVAQIADEHPDAYTQRTKASRQRQILLDVLKTCQMHNGGPSISETRVRTMSVPIENGTPSNSSNPEGAQIG